ncbi:MAG TPA: glycoside hydrolase domain-containing protein, partial [Phycisphaerae bacterium]|nr:glycoside hydrolase domain-containing protein [Phycisphaerae bacterium]
WRIPSWTFANTVADGWWNVEIAIPLSSIGATPTDLSAPWGVRVARNWKRPFAQSQWESVNTSYDDRPSMPVVTWDPTAPVVQVLSLQEEGKAKISVAVRNPHKRPLTVAAHLSDAWHRNPPTERTTSVTVAPGKVETITLSAPDGGPEGLHRTVIRIAGPDGAKTYYFRDFRWNLHRPESVWTIGIEQKRAVDLKLKYYPYHNKIRVRVDIGSLELRDRIAGATAEICLYDRAGNVEKRALWSKELAFGKFVSEGVHEIPDLNDGRYQLAVRFAGGKGIPSEPVTQDFVRMHYEWERNGLGISDEVMPPFTPLKVDGQTVQCVLRDLTHGPDGLWRDVTSQGRAMLTGPMRWEVVTAGPDGKPAEQPVRGGGWKVLDHKPTGVIGQADWSAGPVKARVRTEYDYDGMMLVKLTVAPTGGTAVRRLSLAIPVGEDEARYMHAVSDGLRHNYAGFVPSGEGRVWDSGKANRIDLVGTFFPYLWVGGAERGVCWFADTDRDMVLDDETPAIELVREGKTLWMRVHLITRPGALRREHEIVFGLQVTPTKPMPAGWRKWVGNKHIPGGRNVAWIGGAYYWGALSYDVYPMDKRFEMVDVLAGARRTGQTDPGFLDHWMRHVEQVYPAGTKGYDMMRAHVNHGLHLARTNPWSGGTRLFIYTNARGVGFRAREFATFQDEWLRYGWFNRDWPRNGGIAYDLSPSESFVDYAVWYYKRMLGCFDGVYWDNMYLSPHYDAVVGSAWNDAKGRTHPGLGLFHLRNLVKRTAVMHWRQGRGQPASRLPFIQLSHM